MKKKTFILLVFIVSLYNAVNSQAVPHSIKNTGIYDFLDELANSRVIEINSAIKPYSRMFIALKLKEADSLRQQLNLRQQKELDFYLLDFNKETDRRNGATAQGNKGATAQRRNGATAKGRNGATEQGRKGATAQRRNGATAKGSNGATAQWRNGVTAKGRNGATEQGNKGATAQWRNGVTAKGSNGVTAKGIGGQWPYRRHDLFYYEDSLFSLTINPILGGEIFSNSSGTATYWRNGAEARAYASQWGFYATLRDNHEDPLLGKPEYLSQRDGGSVKNGTDWSDMQGGVTWSWKWGNIGLVKDLVEWGNNYNGSNILSGRYPSFVQFRLNISPVKWFDFNYFHGWLDSRLVDSTKSFWTINSYGTSYREVYHHKYIAANMFTFTPFRNFNISAGNSIVYDYEKVNPAYLIPLFFYKSVDHSQTMGIDNMNSQMFFDISSRQIKNLHLYASLFIDELSVNRITKDDEWNFLSYKTGFRLSNFPVQNLSFTTEYTYTYPLTFQHYVPTTTFETAGYNLGHYLKDNSREWYLAFDYRPLRAMNITVFLTDAVRGPDYTELGTNRLGNPPLASVEWHNTRAGLRASYQVINDLYTWVSASYSEISGDMRWSPEYMQGYKTTLNVGVTVGF